MCMRAVRRFIRLVSHGLLCLSSTSRNCTILSAGTIPVRGAPFLCYLLDKTATYFVGSVEGLMQGNPGYSTNLV
jgi:hypothetical protein